MKFIFKLTEVSQELLLKYPPYAVDGNLTIIIRDSVFFNEEGISLLDLALNINGWLHELKSNPLADFDYSADEYQENPVIYLTSLNTTQHMLYSAWVPGGPELILETAEIKGCFRRFLHELDMIIQQDYGVAFSEMRFFNSPWPTIYPA